MSRELARELQRLALRELDRINATTYNVLHEHEWYDNWNDAAFLLVRPGLARIGRWPDVAIRGIEPTCANEFVCTWEIDGVRAVSMKGPATWESFHDMITSGRFIDRIVETWTHFDKIAAHSLESYARIHYAMSLRLARQNQPGPQVCNHAAVFGHV